MEKKSGGAGQSAGDESFLGRWSRRKRAEPEQRQDEDAKVSSVAAAQRAADDAGNQPGEPSRNDPAAPPADLPKIEDLTPASDYRRFMQPDVPRASRNAAMKKLFTDPHFNVMDGLDTYIDDYTKEDPIPLEMLRDLAQSRMLKLFDEPEEKEKSTADSPETVGAQGSRQSVPQDAFLEPVFGGHLVEEPAASISLPSVVPAVAPAAVPDAVTVTAPPTTGAKPSV